jgi:hypothetical protein
MTLLLVGDFPHMQSSKKGAGGLTCDLERASGTWDRASGVAPPA